MYNLRFELDDDGRVRRICFKKIPLRNEIDILTYQDIILGKSERNKLFKFLVENNINHYSYSDENNIHDFRVNEEDIRSLLKESREYKNKMAIKRANDIERGKFTPKKKENKKEQHINRTNKFNKKPVLVGLSTLVILGSIVGIVSANKPAVNDPNIGEETRIETQTETKEEPVIVEEPVAIIETKVNAEEHYDEVFNLSTENAINDPKFINCKNLYGDIITKYANTYGIDPDLAIAIACQERGVHSDQVDEKGGLGLFQIQVEGRWNWIGKEVQAYNFDTNSYEKYRVELDNVRNLEDNVKLAMMILQDDLIRNDYNIALGVQEYNTGYTGVQNALVAASTELNTNIDKFVDIGNLEWLSFRNYAGCGDTKYLEHVFRYVPQNKVLCFKIPNQQEKFVKYANTLENIAEIKNGL